MGASFCTPRQLNNNSNNNTTNSKSRIITSSILSNEQSNPFEVLLLFLILFSFNLNKIKLNWASYFSYS
jgi:hypothetical protein